LSLTLHFFFVIFWPNVEEVPLHPLFWSKEKKLRFFCDASDEIKFCNDVNILAEVENININVP
jgi:hypothetical protein